MIWVLPSVLVIAGSTITCGDSSMIGALHFDFVFGTGSSIPLQVRPEGLAWLSQLTTNGT